MKLSLSLNALPVFLFVMASGASGAGAASAAENLSDGGPKEKYIVVGVAGFKTSKPDNRDISSDMLARDSEMNGAWTNLPSRGVRIQETYYLTHFQEERELDRALERFDDRGGCDPKLGLVIMANSWGSNGANALAYKYYKKCGRLADFFVMVDGVQKPLGAYKEPVWSARCLNYFQNKDPIHGGELKNCENIDLGVNMRREAPMFENHIRAEWQGTSAGASEIRRFMSDPCSRAQNDDFAELHRAERNMEMIVDRLYNHTNSFLTSGG